MECELKGLTKATEYLMMMTRACVMTSDVDICGEGKGLAARALDQSITTTVILVMHRASLFGSV